MNGVAIHAAEPVAWFYNLLGKATRVAPAGPPAPVGHRNNNIHYYDHLGITLIEHHYTYQIQAVIIVLDTGEAIHPTAHPFSGTLDIGGVNVVSGDAESVLGDSQIRFTSQLAGIWLGRVNSAPLNGRQITVGVHSAGRRLPSGRRSRVRRILTVELDLEHDPWETRFRPKERDAEGR